MSLAFCRMKQESRRNTTKESLQPVCFGSSSCDVWINKDRFSYHIGTYLVHTYETFDISMNFCVAATKYRYIGDGHYLFSSSNKAVILLPFGMF